MPIEALGPGEPWQKSAELAREIRAGGSATSGQARDVGDRPHVGRGGQPAARPRAASPSASSSWRARSRASCGCRRSCTTRARCRRWARSSPASPTRSAIRSSGSRPPSTRSRRGSASADEYAQYVAGPARRARAAVPPHGRPARVRQADQPRVQRGRRRRRRRRGGPGLPRAGRQRRRLRSRRRRRRTCRACGWTAAA